MPTPDSPTATRPQLMEREVLVCWWMLLAGGLAIALITPPLHSPDEPVHFFRAYAVSEGHFTAERRDGQAGSMLPCDLPRFDAAMREGVSGNGEVKMPADRLRSWRDVGRPRQHPSYCFVQYTSAAVYTPVTYLPSAVAIRIARIANASFIEQLYAMRFANLLLSWLLTAFAIRIAPSAAWSMLAVSSLPMEAFLRSTHVSDSLVGALALVIVAGMIRAVDSGEPTGGVPIAAAVLLCLTKPLYLFVPFLILLPGKLTGSGRRRAGLLAVLVATAVLALAFSRAGYVPRVTAVGGSSSGVAAVLFDSPFRTALLSVDNLAENLNDYRMGFVGVLGWLDAPVPRTTSLVLLVMLVAIVTLEARQIATPRWLRIAVLFAIAASVVLLQLSIYVSWTPAGSDRIIGVQGRYFLPLAPLLLLVLPRVGAPRPALVRVIGLCFVPAALAIAIGVLVTRYWI